jgi:uncharacterized SAM-binding protein YcdF (DUF218 family)
MFFVLSKTLNFLAMPLVLVFLLFAVSAVVKRALWKKRLFWTALGVLYLLSNDFLANEAMHGWEIPPTPFDQVEKTYTYGIILTGVTHNDLQPDDRVYFRHGADRVVHTVDLYKRGIIKKILISGGTGRLVTEGRPEAMDLVKAVELMGVDTASIEIEIQSRNTYESAVNVKQILDGEEGHFLLITSAFHMRRSMACFRRAGVDVDAFSTDFYTHPRYFTPDALVVPKPEAIMIWHKLFKEWMGMAAYWMAGYI